MRIELYKIRNTAIKPPDQYPPIYLIYIENSIFNQE